MKRLVNAAACLLGAGAAWFNSCYAQSVLDAEKARPAMPAAVAASPTLRAAVDAAWARATGAQESAAMRMRAEAERQTAQRLWAAPPSIEMQHRDDRLQSNAGRRETEVGVSWPMWLPGQQSANEVMTQAGVDRAHAGERAARLQVAGVVRESVWRLIVAASERAQLVDQADVLHRLYVDVEKRVRAGDLARADALAAHAQWLDAKGRLNDASQRLEEARIRWRELTGLEREPDPASVAERTASTGVPDDHPELDAAIRNVEYAQRRLAAVRASTREPPELKLGVRQDVSGGVEGSHNSILVGVRLPFGTEDRNRPLEAAALGELAVAQAVEQRLRRRLHADADAARAAVSAAQAQLVVERERARVLGERAALIDRSFRAGESALPELLRTLGAASQADAAAHRQAIVLERSKARLNQAIGILP